MIMMPPTALLEPITSKAEIQPLESAKQITAFISDRQLLNQLLDVNKEIHLQVANI